MDNEQTGASEVREQPLRESLRVQKEAYVHQQLVRRRDAEDQRMARLRQEQAVINALRDSIDDSLWETEELRKYNQEFQENVNAQIYEAHGISADKLTGMRSYRSAVYRGVAVVSFLLSLALTVFCGVLHGFSSELFLLMAAYTAAEGALLSQEKRQFTALFWLCRCLYVLTLPAMAVAFVCCELDLPLYDLILPYAGIPVIVLTVLGALSYFLHDPYREDRKMLRQAAREIRRIERQAKKDVRAARKAREKAEKAALQAAGGTAAPEGTGQPQPTAPEAPAAPETAAAERVTAETAVEEAVPAADPAPLPEALPGLPGEPLALTISPEDREDEPETVAAAE